MNLSLSFQIYLIIIFYPSFDMIHLISFGFNLLVFLFVKN